MSTENVQESALNGAQVTALKDILISAAAGQLPRDSAVQLIMVAFQLDQPMAERLMGPIGRGFELPAESGAAGRQ